jgi:hypothetical protein
MLDLLVRHSRMDVAVKAKGDLHIDHHHTTEDVGIAFGQAVKQALGDMKGITRYADVHVPMDEALTRVALDVSGRPLLVFKTEFGRDKVGTFDTELVREWFNALPSTAEYSARRRSTAASPARRSGTKLARCARPSRSANGPRTKSRRPARSAADASRTGQKSNKKFFKNFFFNEAMSIYTVHVPPAETSDQNPERFVFVRDGFSFWAFLLGPLWMLWHRLWLAFVGYIAVAVLLQIALYLIGASGMVTFTAGVLLALLVGFEAATLRRMTLARRRWNNVGIVVADDAEAAERRFFDAWLHGEPRRPTSPAASVEPMGAGPARASEIIGLFPQPGGSR